jgi:hypothetical protein
MNRCEIIRSDDVALVTAVPRGGACLLRRAK